jgi:DNA-binding protein H-NS
VEVKVAEYGLTLQDIFGRGRGMRAVLARGIVPSKFGAPKAGATWSGRGSAPNRINDVKNRDRYLICD